LRNVFVLDADAPFVHATVDERNIGMTASSELRVISITEPADIKRFDQMLADEHWLGAGHSVGHYLRQVVVRGTDWVALLTWGPAARRLRERDQKIGWDAAKRAERLKLLVQNRRFLVPQATREPNLASQTLGAAVRALPAMWRERFGYAPHLAETFTDPEAHAGTCYRASGWTPCEFTAGFSRDTQDYFVDNEHPKKLWLKPLHPDWRERLRARTLHPDDVPARIDSPERVLPLPATELASLCDALSHVPDPRKRWGPFRLGTVLAIIVMARMCDRNSIAAIERYGKGLHQKHRKMLDLPINPETGLYRAPDYMVYYKLLRALDLEALAAGITDWSRGRQGHLPPCLAMDGKMIRELIGTLNITDAATGVAVAMAPLRMKENSGEIKTAQHALAEIGDLQGSVVTGDPLHAQKKTARQIFEQNGEYVLQVKGNQPALHEKAQSRRDCAPFLPSPSRSAGASRSDTSASSSSIPSKPACPTAEPC
jgi:hypothetical protein